MNIFNWLLGNDSPADVQHAQWVGEAVERIVKLNPRLRLARRYQERLKPAAATALDYVIDLVGSLPPAREASAAAWTIDPYVHAFFASADGVARDISRSADLQAHFTRDPELQQVYAVLGMAMSERHVLGVVQDGDIVRRDVLQTTVNFSDHQIRVCGSTEHDLKVEIVRRLLDQLALEGLAQVAADKSRREHLERERALLKTRLQLLERQGAGIRSMVGSATAEHSNELMQLQAQMEENGRNLESLGAQPDAIDRELERVCAVFADPARHISVSNKRMRLNRMNVLQEQGDMSTGEEFSFTIARIPTIPPETRVFSLIRFARVDLLPARSMLDEASRLLS
jgi:hypothetical protein